MKYRFNADEYFDIIMALIRGLGFLILLFLVFIASLCCMVTFPLLYGIAVVLVIAFFIGVKSKS